MAAWVFILLVMASAFYWLIVTALVFTFFQAHKNPLITGNDHYPFISILKPVRGIDPQAFENFASFCTQDYPQYEVLFAVADPFDPIIQVIKRVQRKYTQVSIRLLIVPVQGPNEKAALLSELEPIARGEILVASDSDMRVTPDYLRRVSRPLQDATIGLVTCCYRGQNAQGHASQLAALHMGAMFLPAVLAGRKVIAMRFAMGATLALRTADLKAAGGFAGLLDYLADDYQLALRIIDLGLRVELSDYIVANELGKQTFRELWAREVRWARTNRVNRPMEYPGLLPLFTVTWALFYLLAVDGKLIGWLVLCAAIFFRWLISLAISLPIGDEETRGSLLWLPARDLLSALEWGAGSLSNLIQWRGKTFRVFQDGRLQAMVDRESLEGEASLLVEESLGNRVRLLGKNLLATDTLQAGKDRLAEWVRKLPRFP
jgi:ceramide glucosyltransferase